MRRFLLFGLFISCSMTVIGQTPTAKEEVKCDMPITSAPSYWGLKFGMSVEEVKELYPSIDLGPQQEYGLIEGAVSPRNNVWLPPASRSYLAGVSNLMVNFLDGKLIAFTALYNSNISATNIKDYAVSVSEGLKLPNAWRQSEKYSDTYTLKCSSFELSLVGSPAMLIVGVYDSKASDEVVKRVRALSSQPGRLPFTYRNRGRQ